MALRRKGPVWPRRPLFSVLVVLLDRTRDTQWAKASKKKMIYFHLEVEVVQFKGYRH